MDLSQAQRDRLSFIELKIRFIGEIRRQDLISRFGIQVAAASRDLALYRELVPKNLDYDTKAKIYRYGKWFRPFFEFSAERVLLWLSRGYGDCAPERFRSIIPSDSSGPRSVINLDTLSVVTRAIHQRKALDISYRSLTSGLTRRDFVPFALADNGFRWHVRAFDRKRKIFVDLVIARIADAEIVDGEIGDSETAAQDNQWNRIVDLEMVPHPANIQHPDTIGAEYGMVDGVLKIPVRAALVGYLLQRWNVDCSANHNLKGTEFHLWLRNRETLYGVANIKLAPGYE